VKNKQLSVGDIITTTKKTGKYVGEIVDVSEPNVLIKVIAVLKHPTQGDLHNPKQVDVPFFHQRRALAYNEKTWVQVMSVEKYENEVPRYDESLKEALQTKIEELSDQDDPWVKKSLEQLEDLKEVYFK
jgi:kinase-associated protein B